MIQPRILYDDEEMVLVEKPMGYLIHPNKYAPGSPTCVSYLEGLFRQRIYVVHRLDRAVSGVMVFAKSPEAARALADQFRDRAVDKTYVALVRGSVEERMIIDTPLETSPRSGERGQKVPATTTVRPLSTTSIDVAIGPYSESWYSLVEVHLHTGRFHQARKHLHRASYPIVGDKKHGDNKHNRYFRDHYESTMLFLRAAELRFENPSRTAKVFARVGIPEEWVPILNDLGLAVPSDLRQEPEVDVR